MEGRRVNKPDNKGMSTICGGEQRRHGGREGERATWTLLHFQPGGRRCFASGPWYRASEEALSGRLRLRLRWPRALSRIYGKSVIIRRCARQFPVARLACQVQCCHCCLQGKGGHRPSADETTSQVAERTRIVIPLTRQWEQNEGQDASPKTGTMGQ